MNPRILAFPILATLGACADMPITDPSVRACQSDTVTVVVHWPNGQVDTTKGVRGDGKHCRKAA